MHLRSKYTKKYRAADPEKYAWQTLKDNAKRRGKVFSWDLEDFRLWARMHDYVRLKGIHKGCLTVDRIKSDEGYHKDNIQGMTLELNSLKGFYEGFNPYLKNDF